MTDTRPPPEGWLEEFIRSTHLLEPDDLPDLVDRTSRAMGATHARVLLVDHEQRELRELVHPRQTARPPLPIDSTLAGRVFQTLTDVVVPEGGDRLLVPVLDGTHRLGVLEVTFVAGRRPDPAHVERFATVIAHAVVSKSAYGDTIEVTRRRRPMALRAEAQRQLLPPLTLASPRFLVTAMLEPSLEVAGDVFDFAVNDDVLHIAILDAMGHSLNATLIASVAIAAYRNVRRGGGSLVDMWGESDRAVARELGGEQFATAVFAELDLADGRLRSVSAGHPSALVMRENRLVARCVDEPTLPLGLGGSPPAVTSTQLQPGDRLLLFTDGMVEGRDADGAFFGEERLVEHLARELDSGLPPPEAVRRLVRTVVEHQGEAASDDATIVLAEWRNDRPERSAGTAEE